LKGMCGNKSQQGVYAPSKQCRENRNLSINNTSPEYHHRNRIENIQETTSTLSEVITIQAVINPNRAAAAPQPTEILRGEAPEDVWDAVAAVAEPLPVELAPTVVVGKAEPSGLISNGWDTA
jgi:hypothetical protein